MDKIVIVGGGFEEEHPVKCSSPDIDIRELKRFHKEADTRMILHCVHSDAEFPVVSCQDTDIFFLLVQFTPGQNELQARIVDESGGIKEAQVSIHTIRELLKETIPEVKTILSFHAITGYDTVSYFAGH